MKEQLQENYEGEQLDQVNYPDQIFLYNTKLGVFSGPLCTNFIYSPTSLHFQERNQQYFCCGESFG